MLLGVDEPKGSSALLLLPSVGLEGLDVKGLRALYIGITGCSF